jgi:hypothetical protein
VLGKGSSSTSSACLPLNTKIGSGVKNLKTQQRSVRNAGRRRTGDSLALYQVCCHAFSAHVWWPGRSKGDAKIGVLVHRPPTEGLKEAIILRGSMAPSFARITHGWHLRYSHRGRG